MSRFCLLLSFILCAAQAPAILAKEQGSSLPARLPELGLDLAQSSVSGLSSGAFMASQFYIAHSNIMVGAGIIAGGPYLCAQSWELQTYLINATTACMNPPNVKSGPNTPLLLEKTRVLAGNKKIDALANLPDDRLYLFSGQADNVVYTRVVDQTNQFFLQLGVSAAAILYNKNVNAGHAMITDNDDDGECGKTQAPFINDCDFELSHAIIEHIYGKMTKPPAKKVSGELLEFNQKEFIDFEHSSMSDKAYVYIPAACRTEQCRLHVVFHGCLQGAEVIGDDYYAETGYNEIADSHNMVVLYPQVRPSTTSPFNPQGCWDFWGYSSPNKTMPDYYSKEAPQLRAVRGMVDRLAGKPNTPH